MSPTDNEVQASLAPPGAGIPFIHRMLGRYLLKPFVLRRSSFSESERRFNKAHEKFKRELALIPAESLTVRVLVPPQQGLEDSSRYWSAALCARHLTIVGGEVEEMILRLVKGLAIDRVADTAAVKPELSQNDPASVSEYHAFGDTLFERLRAGLGDAVDAVNTPDSKPTFQHPWFGPMTAKEWTALYSIHTYVHLEQLKAIRAGLRS
jgi:hypothetical protein